MLPERWNEADGVSVATPFLALLSDEDAFIHRTTLPSVVDLDASLSVDAEIVVIDRETGERFPVWAETDLHGETPGEQTLVIRPTRALPFGRRVAVAITDGVRLGRWLP